MTRTDGHLGSDALSGAKTKISNSGAKTPKGQLVQSKMFLEESHKAQQRLD
jgi:hypothetical protein